MAMTEIYVKLAVGFPRDQKVRALSRLGAPDAGLARDLYVQMLLYCKENLTDGLVPVEEVGLLAYPLPSDQANQLAKQLASVGLTKLLSNNEAEFWEVLAFVRRNGTKEDVEQRSKVRAEAGRKGGRPAGKTGSTAGQERGQATGNQIAKQNESRANPETETETDTGEDKTLGRQADRVPTLGSDDDPDFAAFWSAYPRKESKGTARKAWRTARRKADAQTIIKAAERYRDDPARKGSAREFTAHPATWLNGERWADYPERRQLTAVTPFWEN